MTRTPRLFGGSMTALATPFKEGRIDERTFVRLCERQIERGTTALIVCGSTGEAPALSPDEQAALIRMAVVTAGGQIPVIAGCSGPSTEAAAAIAQLAAACDGFIESTSGSDSGCSGASISCPNVENQETVNV